MPANTKYLSTKGQRALKITAGIIGGYLLSASFHLMLACIPASKDMVVVFSGISFFLTWTGLMIVAFLAKQGWKIWALYLGLTVLFAGITWLIK